MARQPFRTERTLPRLHEFWRHGLPQILVGLAVVLVLTALCVVVFSQHPRTGSVPLLVALVTLVALGLRVRRPTRTEAPPAHPGEGAAWQPVEDHQLSVTQPQKPVAPPQQRLVQTAQPTPQSAPAPNLKRGVEPAIFPPAPVPALVGDRLVLGDLQLIAASRIGRRHVEGGTVREDSYAVRKVCQGLLAVVADGVGSTRAAHSASDLVSRSMAEWPWDLSDPTTWSTQVRECVESLERTLLQQIGDPRTAASTMVFVLLQPTEAPNHHRLWWAALGDSELLVVSGTDCWTLINEEPRTEREGTSALPGHATQVEAGVVDLDMTHQQVLLGTDGFAEPFHRDPAASMRDLGSALAAGDPSYLLAAIRQTGSAFHDDATAVLIAGRRE